MPALWFNIKSIEIPGRLQYLGRYSGSGKANSYPSLPISVPNGAIAGNTVGVIGALLAVLLTLEGARAALRGDRAGLKG